MKKLFRFALCAFALLAVLTLRAQSEAPNFPLPVRPDTLRILGVGNSFTDDGMMYLPELLEAAGIRNVVLGRLYYPGCSLRQHCEFDAADAPKYTYYKSGATAGRRSPRRPPCAKRSATSGGMYSSCSNPRLIRESIRLIIRGSNDLSNGCVSTAPMPAPAWRGR